MTQPPTIKQIAKWLLIGVILVLAIVIGFFVFFFHANNFGGPQDFSDFANYFSGMVTPFFSLISVLMIVFTIWYQAYDAHEQKMKNRTFEAKEHLERYLTEFNRALQTPLFIDVDRSSTSRKISLEDLLNPLHLLEYESDYDYLRKCSELRQLSSVAPDERDQYAKNKLADIVGVFELACIAFGQYLETTPSEVESCVYYETLYRHLNDFNVSKLLFPDQLSHLSKLISHWDE